MKPDKKMLTDVFSKLGGHFRGDAKHHELMKATWKPETEEYASHEDREGSCNAMADLFEQCGKAVKTAHSDELEKLFADTERGRAALAPLLEGLSAVAPDAPVYKGRMVARPGEDLPIRKAEVDETFRDLVRVGDEESGD